MAHNLDDGVSESFEFQVRGHSYVFRHLTTEEMQGMQKLEGKELEEYLYQFISKKDPADSATPDFKEVAKTMITPQWNNFKKMVMTEFGAQ